MKATWTTEKNKRDNTQYLHATCMDLELTITRDCPCETTEWHYEINDEDYTIISEGKVKTLEQAKKICDCVVEIVCGPSPFDD